MTRHADPAIAHAALELAGHVLGPARVRCRPVGTDGRSVPVLCFEMQCDGPAAAPVRVEQAFAANAWPQCEAAARRFAAGQHVRVEGPVSEMRLTLGATHIHIDHKPKEATKP